ncbi:hypothetical protein GGQ88_000264 [Novosphingobium hassiacum]|uniref:Uncharacterized protein n=1 Tax=Novosphingobium hassiacum TaxID=173676 RepID=A0A7W6EUS6_9SPHN|nr:hypothetical protein [Novosphingobium hassiacum]MBB3859024.1 hypothetical protein [Novosphingobium hassiacum]
MSENGTNEYDVTYGRIMFLQKIIIGHDNVKSFSRHSDLVFDVDRIKQNDTIQIVCVDEYSLSESLTRKIISDFPDVDIIFVGGKWNNPTGDSLAVCKPKKIGIFNAGSINAAISKTQYWR